MAEACDPATAAGDVSTVHGPRDHREGDRHGDAGGDGAANLQFTVNVKVDGVNRAGLLVGGALNAYRYVYNAAREGTSVTAPFERFGLTAGTAAGNYRHR